MLMSFSLHALLFGLLISPSQEQYSELAVNTNPCHYSAEISQEKGEQDLLGIAKQETTDDWLEEAWYFVEFKDNHSEWYEAGINETYNSVEQDEKVTEELLRRSNDISEIVDYHIHPKIFPGCNYTNTPSMDDSSNGVRGAQKFMERNPEIQYESRIITSNGIFVATYSPEIVDEEIAKQTIQTQITPFIDAILDPSTWNYDLLNKPIEDSKRFAAAITTQYAQVEFMPR